MKLTSARENCRKIRLLCCYLFGHFYQGCLLAEDRFKKEDLVKNAVFFFRQSVKLKFFFTNTFFFL